MPRASEGAMQSPAPQSSHKRKRASPDQNGRTPKTSSSRLQQQQQQQQTPGAREEPSQYSNTADDVDMSGINPELARTNPRSNSHTPATPNIPQLNVPGPTELVFSKPAGDAGEDEKPNESSFDISGAEIPPHDRQDNTPFQHLNDYNPGEDGDPSSQMIPAENRYEVGSEGWHRIRKNNHKEVERRRRETINEGINELAKIVPGSDKNKGAILQRAVEYISQLKDNEERNISKWTLEKALTDQAIQSLSDQTGFLKKEVRNMREQLRRVRRKANDAGVALDDEEDGTDDPAMTSLESDGGPVEGTGPTENAMRRSASGTGRKHAR